jgi:hypothetical protein
VGLSLLLFVSWLDPSHDSSLHKATNIYAVQALVGGALGFWRIWKRRADPRTSPAVVAIWICAGLIVWTLGQGLWIWASFEIKDVPYPWWGDLFYLLSDLFWLVALYKIYTSLGRTRLPAISPFTKILIPITISLILTGLPTWVASRIGSTPNPWVIACDFAYILLTFSSLILAIGLVLGDNTAIPFPLHQCIRYLCAATVIDTAAVMAFTITVKLPSDYALAYFNGNWADWLFLTAMYFWGASALKWPIRNELLHYSFETARLGLLADEIYRAIDIAHRYSPPTPLVSTDSLDWIREHIPNCWRVVKLGNLVVGSTLIFPVPKGSIKRYQEERKTSADKHKEQLLLSEETFKDKLERRLFDEVQTSDLDWDCLYLAEATILPEHRRRGLAFKSFCETIDDVASRHPGRRIEVYGWPEVGEQTKLFEKLRDHFKNRIPFKKILE